MSAGAGWERLLAVDTLDNFDAVYAHYYPDIYRAVRAIVLDAALAEDVVQDSFLLAYRHRERFIDGGNLGGWLYRIATRQGLNAARRRWQQDRILGLVKGRAARASAPPAETADLVAELLAELPPIMRATIALYHLHGYRYKDVAEILDVPEGTVASRIAKGMGLMRKSAEGRMKNSAPGMVI